jgi:tetratricopeptide (TPR) repeat protein
VVIADYIHSLPQKLVITLNEKKMSRENTCFLYYLQMLSAQKIELVLGATQENFILNDKPYLLWSCFLYDGCRDFTEDIEKFLCHGWRCAEIGADETAFEVLETGQVSARVFYIKQIYLLQLQFMRIATQHYEEAANETRYIAKDFECLYQQFCLTMAWGNILSRRPEEAGRFFTLAGINMQTMPTDMNSLYRMNIFALWQHLEGRIDNAFIIEHRIKKALQESDESHPQIAYINAINLASLYRTAGNYHSAKEYYDTAFSIPRNVKSETELIYSNICYGKLYESQKEFHIALQYWIKAAIHWKTASNPQALGWRTVRAIAFYNYRPKSWLELDLIDSAIMRKIGELESLATGNENPIAPEQTLAAYLSAGNYLNAGTDDLHVNQNVVRTEQRESQLTE